MTHYPALDGVRGVAIAIVLLEHFGFSRLHLGEYGVYLFFVLSGYLITRILLDARDNAAPIRAKAWKFFTRRFVRLSPPLFMALAVGYALDLGPTRTEWWIHALYLTNFKVAAQGDWGRIDHFWSLAVEEQFYLLWFIAVVAVPKRYLLTLIIAGICVSPLFRGAYKLVMGSTWPALQMLPSLTEFLCGGALLAYLECAGIFGRWPKMTVRTKTILTLSVLTALALSWSARAYPSKGWYLYYNIGIVTASVFVVWYARSVPNSRFLAWRPLCLLGQISYGLYVYHVFVPLVLERFFTFDPNTNRLWFVPLCAIAVTVAYASWRWIEQPLLNQTRTRITPAAASS